MSASSQTIVAALPPSSRTRRLAPAARATAAPVAALPVKLTTSTSCSAHRAAPTSPPPWSSCTASTGAPASSRSATSAAETAGACGGALTIVVLPAANAAPSLWARRLAGALNGVMASATPAGARYVMAVLPMPRRHPATGSSSPPIWRASAAQIANVSPTRSISPRPSLSGLPSSRAMRRAKSSRRSRAMVAARSSTSARAAGARRAMWRLAFWAYSPAIAGSPGWATRARLTTWRRYGPIRSADGPSPSHSPASSAGAINTAPSPGGLRIVSSTCLPFLNRCVDLLDHCADWVLTYGRLLVLAIGRVQNVTDV